METIIPYLLVGFIFFIIGVLITRWIFKIDTIVDNQKKQYMMMRQVAKALNVEEDTILEIDDAVQFLRRKKQLAKAMKAK
jgi:hypothetical protein